MSHKMNLTASATPNYGATSSTSNVSESSSREGVSRTEFMELSESIAKNLGGVNSTCMQLQKTLKLLASPKSWNPQLQIKVHSDNMTTNRQIEQISVDLVRLSGIVIRGDKQQKLQLEKLTMDFQGIVGKYSKLQKEVAAGMKETYVMRSNNEGDTKNFLQHETEQATLLQAEQQMNVDLQFEYSMLQERERQIKEIEADVLDVNEIMKKVGSLVNEQAESVGRIETSIENAAVEVEMAQSELLKAATHRQNYRRKILYILIIAVIIGLIVTGIIVDKLKN